MGKVTKVKERKEERDIRKERVRESRIKRR